MSFSSPTPARSGPDAAERLADLGLQPDPDVRPALIVDLDTDDDAAWDLINKLAKDPASLSEQLGIPVDNEQVVTVIANGCELVTISPPPARPPRPDHAHHAHRVPVRVHRSARGRESHRARRGHARTTASRGSPDSDDGPAAGDSEPPRRRPARYTLGCIPAGVRS